MTTYGPYSPIKQAGDFYFIAGQVGIDLTSRTTQEDITTQTHQALKNLQCLLENTGLALDDVVKTTVFLRTMDDFAAMNEAYAAYFTEPRPARTCVAVAELPRAGGSTELLIEVDAMAYRQHIKKGSI